ASDCYDRNEIYDAALSEMDDRTHTIWHQIMFAADAVGQDDPLDYNQITPPGGGNVNATAKTWSYLADDSRWLQANPPTIPPPAAGTYSTCTSSAYGGDGSDPNSGVTCLSGRLWSHADNMALGDTDDSNGHHGAQLANHYFPDMLAAGLVDSQNLTYVGGAPTTFYRPDGTYSWSYAGVGIWRPIFLWKTLPDPWEPVAAPGHVSGVLAVDTNGGSLGILQDDGTNAYVPRIGLADLTLQSELTSSSYVWASNVDPSAAVSTIAGGVEGVALSTDGTAMLDV